MSQSISGAESAKLLNQVFDLGKPGGTTADPVTFKRGQDMRLWMMQNRPKPCTILNTNPWPLKLDDPYVRMEVPACSPGTPYVKYVIRGYKVDYGDTQEDGSLIPHPITPFDQARQYFRQAGIQQFFGVVVYDGEASPEAMIEKDALVTALDAEGNPIYEMQLIDGEQTPVAKQITFKEALDEALDLRNHYYMIKVREAQDSWSKPDGAGRKEVSRGHYSVMAEVLFREGHMSERVDFVIQSREDAGLSELTCPICGARPNAGAVKCTANCEYIFDPVKAYKLAIIGYDHVSMDRCTAEEWEEINAVKAERDAARGGKKKKQ